MYASNSALLNALAQQKIDFKQVINFIDARYDFTPTAFVNGNQKNAANENQGSCKVFSFAQLNHLNQLDTLALFAEHYHAVRDHPAGTDHQNIRQFIHSGWQGIHFEGQALQPKTNIDEINRKVAQAYAAGGSEFTQVQHVENPQPTENQPGAVPTPNPPSDELIENTQNLTEASDVKDVNGNIDIHAQASDHAVNSVADTPVVDIPVKETAHVDTVPANAAPTAVTSDTHSTHVSQDFDEKAVQAIAEAEAANSADKTIPPAPGSSNTMNSETTYLHDNDSVTAGTATTHIEEYETKIEEPEIAPENSLAQSSASGISASELVESNAAHSADNPAAFIEEHNTSTDSSKPATTPDTELALTPASEPQPAPEPNLESDLKSESTLAPDTGSNNPKSEAVADSANSSNKNTLASASASELVHANANHAADNPAAFIEEKNTDTASSEPAMTDSHEKVAEVAKPPTP